MKLSLFLNLIFFVSSHVLAQNPLIDLQKTDGMKKHRYPETNRPLEAVLLNVYDVNDFKSLDLKPYKNLQVLRIENSDLKDIVIDFDVFPQLQSLYISRSTFESLSFKGRPQHFTEIMLYDKHFDNYDFLAACPGLTQVCVSDSSRLDIDNLTKNLLLLPHLNSIYISEGQLKKLPESFKQFKKIDWLSLTYMDSSFDLASVFETIKDIDIYHLNLMGSAHAVLPDNIAVLQKIRYLGIVSCNFKTLPESIGSLTQLEEISASMSSLESLPAGIINLKNLKILSLMPCGFTSIPEVLYQMTWLQELEIGHFDWFPSDKELKPLRKALKGVRVNE